MKQESEKVPTLSPVESEIMRLLVTHGEMYGLELVAASKILKAGTIYVTLGRMADKGFVTSRTVKLTNERGLPRRLFKLTGLGERALRATEAAHLILREAYS